MTKKKQPALKFGSPEVIKEYRRKNGLNQSEFWSRVGVTQSGGSRYESGRNIPRPVQLLLQLTYSTDAQAGAMLEWLRDRTSGNGAK
jgi:Helix-turn-helix.